MGIDLYFLNVERKLSNWAILPILGAVPGIAKMGMGAIQTSVAGVVGVGVVIPAWAGYETPKYLLKRSWTHIKHGIGNIGAGFVEGFPVVGTIVVGLQWGSRLSEGSMPPHFANGQSDKIMPYTSLYQELGYLDGHFDNDSFDLFRGMSYQEARQLCLINENYQISDDWVFDRVTEKYKENAIRVQGKFKRERDAEMARANAQKEADRQHAKGLLELQSGVKLS